MTLTMILMACGTPLDQPSGGELRACTLIGCESHVRFELATDLEAGLTYAVEACVDGACTHETIDVAPGAPLGAAGAITVDVTSDTVTLRLVGDDYSGAHEVSLVVTAGDDDVVEIAAAAEFERLQPNGEGCEPICWQATVRV